MRGVTNIKPIRATQFDTKLPAMTTVNLVLMVDVYHECTDPEGILKGLCKALKTAGRLVLVEFRGEDDWVPIKPEHKMTLDQVRREVEPQGFVFKNSLEFLPWQHVIIFEKRRSARQAHSETPKPCAKGCVNPRCGVTIIGFFRRRVPSWGAEMMSDPLDIETAEYDLVISPSAADSEGLKPASTSVRAEFGAVSHPGLVRAKNEDHFLVSQTAREHRVLLSNVPKDHVPVPMGDDGYVMIVADGMGGMAAGEVASRQAIATGLKLIQNSPKWGFKINRKEAREFFERISGHLQEIDRTLTEQSYRDRRYFGMGTTLTAAYSVGFDLFIIHVGDRAPISTVTASWAS